MSALFVAITIARLLVMYLHVCKMLYTCDEHRVESTVRSFPTSLRLQRSPKSSTILEASEVPLL